MTGQDDRRRALVERWLDLTRRVLPAMATEQHWPIRLDHCFMRVCLDAACGGRWTDMIKRPAIRHAPDEALRRAIAVAEQIAEHPLSLSELNRASLAARGHDQRRG